LRTASCPDEHFAILISGEFLDVDELFFEVLDLLIVQAKLALENPIRYALSLPE
jgi:hypothetical protein